jgi:DNA primase catalytic core
VGRVDVSECKLRTARTFGLGFYAGKGLLRGRIVIPIHNEAGELVAYAGRAIDCQEPKYRFPAGFRKSLVLFNLHRAIATKASTVIVVEGFFDTIAVYQAGYPVVGLMGSALSRHQTELLVSHFDRAALMLDGDDAGRQGTAAIHTTLASRMAVTVISLEDGNQPDQLPPDRLRTLITGHGNCSRDTRPEAETRTNTSDHTSALAGGSQP